MGKFTKKDIEKLKDIIISCKKYLIGADPEFFIKNHIGNIVSADSLLPDESSKRVDEPALTIYNDGVQGEFKIEPKECRDSIVLGIRKQFKDIMNLLEPKKNNDTYFYVKTHRLSVLDPIIKLDKRYLSSLTSSAKTFGCKPDYNTYNDGRVNDCKLNGSRHLFRYGGGHIHISLPINATIGHVITQDGTKLNCNCLDCVKKYAINKDEILLVHPLKSAHDDKCITIVKLMDIFLGIFSVLLTRDKYKEERSRRRYYGRAGDYRITSYGFEYRTLSNFWLINPAIASLMFGLARVVQNIWNFGGEKLIQKILDVFNPDEIKDIINNCDVDGAKEKYEIMKTFLYIDKTTPLYRDNTSYKWLSPFTTEHIELIDDMLNIGVHKMYSEADFLGYWGIFKNPSNNEYDINYPYSNGFIAWSGTNREIIRNIKYTTGIIDTKNKKKVKCDG